jgi:hypothetical protein
VPKTTQLRKTWKTLFNKTTAIGWVAFAPVAYYFGWSEAVTLVWFASCYANAKTDWATAEAADDRAVIEKLDRIEELLKNGNCNFGSSDRSSSVLRGGSSAEYRSNPLESGGPGTATAHRGGTIE